MKYIVLAVAAIGLSLAAHEADAQTNDSWIFCDTTTDGGDRIYTPVFRGNWDTDIHEAFENRVDREWTPILDPQYCHFWLIRDGASRDDAQDYLDTHVMQGPGRKIAIAWTWSHNQKKPQPRVR